MNQLQCRPRGQRQPQLLHPRYPPRFGVATGPLTMKSSVVPFKTSFGTGRGCPANLHFCHCALPHARIWDALNLHQRRPLQLPQCRPLRPPPAVLRTVLLRIPLHGLQPRRLQRLRGHLLCRRHHHQHSCRPRRDHHRHPRNPQRQPQPWPRRRLRRHRHRCSLQRAPPTRPQHHQLHSPQRYPRVPPQPCQLRHLRPYRVEHQRRHHLPPQLTYRASFRLLKQS